MAKLKKINEVPEITEFGGGEKMILNQDGKARQINKDNLGFANDSEVLKKNEQELSEAEQMQVRKNLGLYYTTDPVETELVNGTFAFADSGSGFYATQDINIELTVGTTYKVTIDGVEYETVCQSYGEVYSYIGAPEFFDGATPPSDMPFIYTVTEAPIFGINNESDSHNISIASRETQDIKLPNRYLPMATENDIGADYKRIVVIKKKTYTYDEAVSLYDYFTKHLMESMFFLESRNSQDRIVYLYFDRYNKEMQIELDSGIRYYFGSNSEGLIDLATAPSRSVRNNVYTPQLHLTDENHSAYFRLNDTPLGLPSWTYTSVQLSGTFLEVGALIAGGVWIDFQNITDNGEIWGAEDGKLKFSKHKRGQTLAYETKAFVFNGDKELILASSTADSTKKFKITVDDTGTLTATEVV